MLKKIFLIVSFFTFGCAIQAPPGGGPVDRTPPQVMQVSLQPGSVHVPLNLSEIKITFSERMKEGSERNNLFVSPPIDFSVDWHKGKILQINLEETLQKEQTYVFTVGSGLQDLHTNKMAQSFTLAFSTGDTIDQGEISGQVYGLKPNQIFNIFAYSLNDSASFDPFTEKPDYVSQTGQQGEFVLSFLRNGCYRLIAVEDRNHNFHLDALVEKFALTYTDVCLDSTENVVKGLGFQIAPFDTLAPKIVAVRALFNDFIRARFSEPVVIDSPFIFTIQDSARKNEVPVLGFGKSLENKNWLEIVTPPLDSSRTYLVKFLVLKDSSGNIRTGNLIKYFKSVTKIDTTQFRLVRYAPKDSAKNIRPEAKIYFRFSTPVRWLEVFHNFKMFLASGQQIAGRWQVRTLYDAYFIPEHYLQPDSQYVVRLDLSKIHDLRGRVCKDSLRSFTFFVISNRELGSVSGQLIPAPNKAPVILRLRKLNGIGLTLQSKIRRRNTFYFANVPEGKYRLEGFMDLNNNNRLDAGRLIPFTFCEPFAIATDTIQVRKRWETSNIKFYLPEVGKR